MYKNNIQYELMDLERIALSGRLPDTTDTNEILFFAEIIRNEIDRIKQILVSEVVRFNNENHLQRYMHTHQHALIRLLNQCANGIEEGKSSEKQPKASYSILVNNLNDLLQFMRQYFPKYFDMDAVAPKNFLKELKNEMNEKISAAIKTIDSDKPSKNLFALYITTWREALSDEKATYRMIQYATKIQAELVRIAPLDQQPDFNDIVLQSILYLNCNAVEVFAFIVGDIHRQLKRAETQMEQMEILSLLLKKINQAQVRPGVAYHHNMECIQIQLVNYLSEEIAYHEKMQRITAPARQNRDIISDDAKIRVEASVSQMAYVIKVLIETKVLASSNLTQTFQFLVKSFVTKRSENISYASFRSKFYNVESGTRESVRTMLTTLIKHIDRN